MPKRTQSLFTGTDQKSSISSTKKAQNHPKSSTRRYPVCAGVFTTRAERHQLTWSEQRRPSLARFLPPFWPSQPCRSRQAAASLCRKFATLASAMLLNGAEFGTAVWVGEREGEHGASRNIHVRKVCSGSSRRLFFCRRRAQPVDY